MAEQSSFQFCDNCKKSFPQSKIATHFGYCRRNIKKCQTCGQMYDINFRQDHQQEFHKLSCCQFCNKIMKPNQVGNHEETCSSRTKFCEYCELNVPIKDYTHHLRDCQARTKNCQKCRKPIANKDYLIHTIQCPGYVEQIKPKRIQKQYQDYNQYSRNLLKRQQNNKRQSKPYYEQIRRQPVKNQYKQSYQQANRQKAGNRVVRQSRQRKHQLNYPSSNNTNTNKINTVIAQNRVVNPPSQSNKIGQDQITISNKYAPTYVNNGDKKVITTTQVYDRQKNAVSNKNIETNKYGPSTRSTTNANSYTSGTNTGVNSNSVSSKANYNNLNHNYQVPSNSNNIRPTYSNQTYSNNSNQPSSKYEIHSNQIPIKYSKQPQYANSKQSYNIASNLPKASNQNYKRQVPREKQNFTKKQDKYKQLKPRQQTNKYSNYGRNQSGVVDLVEQQQDSNHSPYYPSQNYQNSYPAYHGGDNQQDQQLQKAIMASMGMNNGISKNTASNKTKPQFKIDDFPVDMLENDMMNESFYDKQRAIMEELQRNKKRR